MVRLRAQGSATTAHDDEGERHLDGGRHRGPDQQAGPLALRRCRAEGAATAGAGAVPGCDDRGAFAAAQFHAAYFAPTAAPAAAGADEVVCDCGQRSNQLRMYSCVRIQFDGLLEVPCHSSLKRIMAVGTFIIFSAE